jgi:hypothetical protein
MSKADNCTIPIRPRRDASDEQLAENFRDLEQPVRDLDAMIAITLLVWRADDGGFRNPDRMHVVLNQLESMTHGFVDNYRSELGLPALEG